MKPDLIAFGIFQSLVMSVPLCVSIHYGFSWFRRKIWNSPKQKRFRLASISSLIVLGSYLTISAVFEAVNYAGGTHWGFALVSVYLGYLFLLVPLSAIIGYVISFTAK